MVEEPFTLSITMEESRSASFHYLENSHLLVFVSESKRLLEVLGILAIFNLSRPMFLRRFLVIATCATAAVVRRQNPSSPDDCPGYSASNVVQNGDTIIADLNLAGPGCNAYGYDLTDLKLFVQYEVRSKED